MSKLEKLIQKYCPEGVEYVTIENVTKSICSGLNPRQNFSLNVSGADCKYLTVKEMASGKIIFSDKTDKITREAVGIIQNRSRLEANDILLSGIGTIGRIAIVDIPVDDWNCSESVLLLKSDQSIIAPKYLKYILESNDVQTYFDVHATGSTLKGIRQKDLRSLEIPLPPLPVQEEIVRILDTFTELQAELQAELQKRKQQYNYYRDNLLSFNDGYVQMWQLQQCVSEDCSMSYGVVQPGDDYQGGIPVVRPVDLSSFIIHNIGIKTVNPVVLKSYSRTELKGGELLVCVRGTTGVVAFAGDDLKGGNVTRGIVPLRFNSMVNAHYMYHIFNSSFVQKQIESKTQGAALQQINVGDLKKISIPVPTIDVQKKIASILDRFDTLTNDLTAGLPAEIEKRRQQYEYYRDKLLTFNRA